MTTTRSILRGLRVLNTRPIEQGYELSKQINAAGGESIDLPVIVIEPFYDKRLDELVNRPIHQAIFTSSNAVRFFFNATNECNSRILVSAVGKATAAELQKRGIQSIQVPHIADSEHLLELNSLQQINGQTIILVKGVGGRDLIEQTLSARGAQVIPINTYQRTLPTVDNRLIQSLWQNNSIDIILFTSEQAMKNLFILVEQDRHAWLKTKPCVVISQRLADCAYSMGMKTVYVSQYDEVVNSLRKLV